MELVEFSTYRNVLGSLMKNPLLFTQYTDIKTEDFGHKVSKIIFSTINNMFQNGVSSMSPVEVDMEIERYEAMATVYKSENGLSYLNDCYEYSNVENFDYYYKRLKKLSLVRTLKKNHYDVSYYFKEECDTINEENELIERFDGATIEDILQHIEVNYNKIRSDFLTDGNNNANAFDGIKALVDKFKVSPEIGYDMEGLYFSYACRGARLGKMYLRSAQSGTGKRVADYTPIPTPSGWKSVGDIKVGDYIFGKNGKQTKVLNLYKNKEKIWKITFLDGRTIDCCGEHLCEYYYDNDNKRVENTKTIYERAKYLGGFKNENNDWRFKLPMNGAVEYPAIPLDISPYTFGYAVGNDPLQKEIIPERKESHRSNVSIEHMEINYSKDKKKDQINNINEYNNPSMKSNITVIKKSNSKSNLFSKFQKISKEIEKYMNEYNGINNHDRQINKRHNIKCLNRHASYRNIKNENKMLNRNKSMTNLNDRKTSNNHNSINNIVVCPNNQNISQSININQNHEESNETVTIHTSCMKKFNDLQKQKELLKSSLNNCNNVIKERKKLIKLLEDELVM